MRAGLRTPWIILVAASVAALAGVVPAAGPVAAGPVVTESSAAGKPLASTGPETFHGVNPYRVLDTRNGVGAPLARVAAGQTISVQVAGLGGVPATGAVAVVLNLTVDDPSDSGFVTAWPSGEPRPDTSNVNFVADQTVPNLVILKLGTNGAVNLYNDSGTVDLIADVSGWYDGSSQLVPTSPNRLLDTRTGVGGVQGPTSGTVTIQVTGRAGIPSTGVLAAVLNVTATGGTADGFLTVWPAAAVQPTTSNLNVTAGETRASLVLATIGANGAISYYNSAGSTHVVIDVLGYTRIPANQTSPYLTQVLQPTRTNDQAFRLGQFESNGVTTVNTVFYNNHPNQTPNWIEFDLAQNWTTLSTIYAFSDRFSPSTSTTRFQIIGDGVTLHEATLSFGQTMPVTVNVSGVRTLRFDVIRAAAGATTYPAFLDPQLSTTPTIAVPEGSDYTALVPGRLLDTRSGIGIQRAPVLAGSTVDLRVMGREGVPAAGVGAVALNVTVTDPKGSGYVTAWPKGSPRPTASNVNFVAGETAPNLVIVPVGEGGVVSLYLFGATAELIVDVAGWFPGTVSTGAVTANLPQIGDLIFDNDSSFREGTIDAAGTTYATSIYYEGRPGVSPSWVEYSLGRKWRTLTTTFGFADTFSPAGSTVQFRILIDGVEKVSTVVTAGQLVPVTVDITNALRVRFEVTRTISGPTLFPVFLSPTVSQ